jgi:hypothetical protein
MLKLPTGGSMETGEQGTGIRVEDQQQEILRDDGETEQREVEDSCPFPAPGLQEVLNDKSNQNIAG